MSEPKQQRQLEDIQKDYQRGALKAGHIQYQISAFQKDLDVLNNTLRDLNFEAAAANAAAKSVDNAATPPEGVPQSA